MTRVRAFLIALVLWTAIFLPGLGSTEFKGEEGRRILPAMTMLDGGSWLVPYVGGKPFLRKPPLMNWLIAGSFKLTGVRNEWSARFPAALCMLALVAVIIASSTGGGWLKPEGGLLAAILTMTQFGLLAKARFAGAEIEAVYVPLSGIAIVLWMAWWSQRRSPWLTWTVPFLFLGIAALAKGPSLHLLYFYAIVLASLFAARAWRALWHPAHLLGLVLASAIFLAWALPFFQSPEAKDAAAVWKRQGIDRFTESEFNAGNYFLNIPRALMDQLPWVLLVPAACVAWRRRREQPALASSSSDSSPFAFARAVAPISLTLASLFTVLLLIPGVLPRYLLPLATPFALLLAFALEQIPDSNRLLRVWHRINQALAGLVIVGAIITPFAASGSLAGRSLATILEQVDFALALRGAMAASVAIALSVAIIARRPQALRPLQLAIASATLFGLASVLYAVAAVRWINLRDDLRPMAARINAAVPAEERLIIFDPGYLPAICYLRSGFRYAVDFDALPEDAHAVLVRGQSLEKFMRKQPQFVVVEKVADKSGQEIFVLRQGGKGRL